MKKRYLGIIVLSVMTCFVMAGPVNDASLIMWLNADDIMGLSDGETVNTWLDSSNVSPANNAILSDGSPSYVADAASGVAGVCFGDGDGMITTASLTSGDYTVFTIFNCVDAGAGKRAVQGVDNNWVVGPLYGKLTFYADGYVSRSQEVIERQYYAVAAVTDSGAGKSGFYVDGEAVDTGIPIVGYPGAISLATGGRYAQPLHGTLVDVLVYNRLLTPAETAQVNDYLAFKIDRLNALVYEGENGLEYKGYANEGQENAINTVPDFSRAGYQGGGVAIPFVPAVVTISNNNGSADDATLIQGAIDAVSSLPLGSHGFRGAVLLKAGEYSVSNTLNIASSGVVIRGEGSQETGGTRITYAATAQSNLFEVDNAGDLPREVAGTRQSILDAYVPVGATSFNVANAAGFAVGDRVIVQNTMNQQWIDDLSNMGQWGWTPEGYQLRFFRTITEINGNTVTIDAPVMQAIETRYGGGDIYKFKFIGQLENIGIESLRLESTYTSSTDENHGWSAIYARRLKNGWVRQVTGRYFGLGLINLQTYCRYITVEDCAMLDPMSITTGGRKYPFVLDDSDYVFMQRCYSRGARHAFASGSAAPGPNVFVDCRSSEDTSDSGPHHRYSTGQLYDNIMAGYLFVQNREDSGSGHGWAGAQVMFWNCLASASLICDAPTGGMNWCVGSIGPQDQGVWAPEEPFGIWQSHNTPVQPRSLYYTQLAERLGTGALHNTVVPVQEEGDIWDELEVWAGDGLFSDEVVVCANAPVVYSGATFGLKGICRNLRMLENGVSCTWRQLSGQGTVVFGDASAAETSATIIGPPGNYVIELVVDDGAVPVSSTASITVVELPHFEIVSGRPLPSTGEFVLSWQAVAGESYAIKAATNLVGGMWDLVAESISGVEPLCTRTVRTENAQTFYRVELEQ
ncbi:LamG domain-containing protein [Pontiella sulfatireligans]|uniref:LamG-like jellyroll fold domain-containing protein n=1 Tax=Pontiella sulfatireligans TaxID=2750658 RepID=A0A6C2UHW4_9BACT|nr:LamG domain-containing protein [Pontiella sulfatireligans]VGO18816.1 hypothetical protein SCARR_00869 [Pontiella sulfatireligans]